jgi:hypothetical protein
MNCGASLTQNDIALHKKLVNRGAERFLCPGCLGERFSLTAEELGELKARFLSQGCGLFVTEEEEA